MTDATALRKKLISDMESRRGFHRGKHDVDDETVVEWDANWDALIAAALDAVRRETWVAIEQELQRRYKTWEYHHGIEDFLDYCRAQAERTP